jgi:Protein of unknown function (DUF3717)
MLLTINQVAAALGACCRQHPPKVNDYRLHPDASALAEVYAIMVFQHEAQIEAESLPPEQRAAFDRWAPAA